MKTIGYPWLYGSRQRITTQHSMLRNSSLLFHVD